MPTAPDNNDAYHYAERIRERLPGGLGNSESAAENPLSKAGDGEVNGRQKKHAAGSVQGDAECLF
ncbi:MAG: hypothetical protein ACOYMN_20275 [Roseimicrobium sp.]